MHYLKMEFIGWFVNFLNIYDHSFSHNGIQIVEAEVKYLHFSWKIILSILPTSSSLFPPHKGLLYPPSKRGMKLINWEKGKNSRRSATPHTVQRYTRNVWSRTADRIGVSRGEKILKRGCEKALSQDHAAIELFQRRDKRYPSRPSPAAMNINEFRRTGTDKTWKGSAGLRLVCAWQSGNEINFPPPKTYCCNASSPGINYLSEVARIKSKRNKREISSFPFFLSFFLLNFSC